MKRITLKQPGEFESSDAAGPPGEPGPGEALVRVHRVGICGTDLHAYRGQQPFFTYPRVLGHELGVEVIAAGEGVTNVRPGDRCAVEPYLNCGRCIACRRGKPNCCAHLQVLGVHVDGGMRERFAVPATKLHPSGKLSLEQLALVETLGIGAHAVERAVLEPGEQTLVIGAGPIGLGAIQFAAAEGAEVTVTDVSEHRLAFCREQLGIDRTVMAGEGLEQSLRDTCGGDLPTTVLDATGNPQSMTAAFDLVSPGGRLVFVGLFRGDVTFHDPDFHRRELTLLASRNSTPNTFGNVIEAVEAGRIDTSPWITHRTTLEAMPAEFERWLDPASGTIKAMVQL